MKKKVHCHSFAISCDRFAIKTVDICRNTGLLLVGGMAGQLMVCSLDIKRVWNIFVLQCTKYFLGVWYSCHWCGYHDRGWWFWVERSWLSNSSILSIPSSSWIPSLSHPPTGSSIFYHLPCHQHWLGFGGCRYAYALIFCTISNSKLKESNLENWHKIPDRFEIFDLLSFKILTIKSGDFMHFITNNNFGYFKEIHLKLFDFWKLKSNFVLL